MPTITLLGNILPPGVQINIPPMQSIWGERGKTISFEIEIRGSIVRALCTVEKYDHGPDHDYLIDRAIRVTRALVDPIAFREGVRLAVILTDMVKPDGTCIELVTGHAGLSKLCTAFPEDDPIRFQKLLLENPFLATAVHELVSAIAIPGYVPLHCGRALEALRRVMYSAPDPGRKRGWNLMQQELNLAKSYLDPISDHSKEIRHGSDISMDKSISADVLVRSWTIFNRYFEYLERKNQRLTAPEFDLLD